jgi:16S rRNA (guanine(966)-N(2))-methyltransferase RsmD
MRESLFSILQEEIEGAVFYDIYAGSGSVGIEALSRGAARAVFIESDRAALASLRENLKSLKIEQRALVLPKRAGAALSHPPTGIVFADPPYNQPKEYEKLIATLAANPKQISLLLIQHDRRIPMPEAIAHLKRYRELKQGDNVVSFYQP